MTIVDCFRYLLWSPESKAPSRKVCRAESRAVILARRKRQRQARKRQRIFAH
jgi:hypothetical protein